MSSRPRPFVTKDDNSDHRCSEILIDFGLLTVSHLQSVSCSTGIGRRSPSTVLQTLKVAEVS